MTKLMIYDVSGWLSFVCNENKINISLEREHCSIPTDMSHNFTKTSKSFMLPNSKSDIKMAHFAFIKRSFHRKISQANIDVPMANE